MFERSENPLHFLGLSLFTICLLELRAAFAPVIAEAAGPTIDKTTELSRAGKYETFQPVSMDEMAAAVRDAAQDLALASQGEKKTSDHELHLIYMDERKQKIDIAVVRRTSRATGLLVDIGWFGPAGFGELMVRQVVRHLPKSATSDSNLSKESG